MTKILKQTISVPNFAPTRRVYNPVKQHQYYLNWKKKHYKKYLAKLRAKRNRA